MKASSQKNLKRFLIAIIIVLIATICTSLFLLTNKKEEDLKLSAEEAELAISREYELFEEGDEDIENTDNVKFSAFFLRDIDGDGYAEKIKGTCREIGEKDTLYMEIVVQTEGYLKDAKITFDKKNYYLQATIPQDNEIKTNAIGQNIEKIEFEPLYNGTQKLLTSYVLAGDYIYDSGKFIGLDNNINNFSRDDNKVILTGTYVDETGRETRINKEIVFSIDWHGTASAFIKSPDPYTDLNSRINEEKGELNLSFRVKTGESKGILPISKTGIKGTIPELNGYSPIKVSYSGKDSFSYDEETRTFEIIRKGKVGSNGTIINNISKENIYAINVIYPLEAYDTFAMTDIYLKVPVETYYECYNNPNNEFQNPYIATRSGNIYLTFKKYVPYHAVTSIDTIIGEHLGYPYGRDIVRKEKPLKVYNGAESEVNEDYYNVVWEYYSGEYSYEGLVLSDGKIADVFIRDDETTYSMEDLSQYVAISFSGLRDVLGENGWIKVYDEETSNLLLELNNSNFDKYTTTNPYYYDIPAKHIRVETSSTISSKNLTIYNTKEIDDAYITENFTKDEFDSLAKIRTNFNVKLGEEKTLNDTASALYEESFSLAKISSRTESISTQVTTENIEFVIQAENNHLYNELGWKNGVFVVKIPDDFVGVEINDVTVDDKSVTISSYEVVEKDESKYIKIYTSNEERTNFVITLDVNLTPKPTTTGGFKTIGLYAINEDVYKYYSKGKDDLDIDNDNNVEEEINYSYCTLRLVSPNTLLTSQYISDYDDEGSIAMAPQIAEVKPVYDNDGTMKQSARVNIQMMNNYSNTIEELVLLGKIPFIGNTYAISGRELKSEFDAKMTSEGISLSENMVGKVTVYYSENANPSKDKDDSNNGWKLYEQVEDWSKIKTYLIVLNPDVKINVKEEYSLFYDIEVPFEGDYNKIAYNHYGVYFTLNTDDGKFRTKVEPNKVGISFVEKYDFELNKYQKGKDKKIPEAIYKISRIDDEENIISSKTATTDENGYLFINDLLAEAYYQIEEIKSPDQYELNENKVKIIVHVDDDTGEFSIGEIEGDLRDEIQGELSDDGRYKVSINVEDEANAKLTLIKTDADTNERISNAKFTITGKGLSESGKTITTDNNGEGNCFGLRVGEEYRLVETKAVGYYLDNDISFRIVNNNGEYNVEITNNEEQVKKASVIEENDFPILRLELKDEKIPTYSLEITKIKHETEVVASKEEIINENHDSITYLEGTVFNLYKNNKLIGKYTTNSDGKLIIEGLYQYEEDRNLDQSYMLREITTCDGYTKVKDIKFKALMRDNGSLEFVEEVEAGQRHKEYVSDGTTIKIIVEDSPIFKLVKKDGETGELLANSKFAIYNIDQGVEPARNSKGETIGTKEIIDGIEYYTVTTDNNGEVSLDLPEGLYKAVEVKASDEKYDLDNQTYYFGIGANSDSKINLTVNKERSVDGFRPYGNVIETSDGGYLASTSFMEDSVTFGNYTFINGGNGTDIHAGSRDHIDSVLYKVNEDDEIEWALHFKSRGKNNISEVFEAKDGNYILLVEAYLRLTVNDYVVNESGSAYSNASLIMKIDRDGNILWVKKHETNATLNSICETPEGNIIAVGSFYRTLTINNETIESNGDRDALILKYSPDGEYIDRYQLGGTGWDSIESVTISENGDIAVLGRYSETIELGNNIFTSLNSTNSYIACFNSEYEVKWAIPIYAEDSNGTTEIRETLDGDYIAACYFLNKVTINDLEIENTGINDVILEISKEGEIKNIIQYDTDSYQVIDEISPTMDGGFLMCGDLYNSFTVEDIELVSHGYHDGFILKYDKDCNLEWHQIFGTSDYDAVYAIKEKRNGAILLGAYYRGIVDFCDHMFFGKTTGTGTVIELQEQEIKQTVVNETIGIDEAGNETIKAMINTRDGGHIIIGTYDDINLPIGDEILINNDSLYGSSDCFCIKYNAKNEVEWAKTYGTEFDDGVESITETKDGRFLLAGGISGTQFKYDDYEMIKDNYSAGGYVLSIDCNGEIEWIKLINEYYTTIYSVCETEDGGFAVSGINSEYQRQTAVLIKYSKEGEKEWIKKYTHSYYSRSFCFDSVCLASDGGIIVSGYFSGSSVDIENYHFISINGNYSGFVLKYSANGEIEWAKSFGSYNSSRVRSISVTNKNKIIVAGYCDGNLKIDGNVYNSVNSSFYIAELNENGNVENVHVFVGQIEDLVCTDDGGYLVSGQRNDIKTIWKISSNYKIEWKKEIPSASYNSTVFVGKQRNGDYLVAGTFDTDEFTIDNFTLENKGNIDSFIFEISEFLGCRDVQELEVENNRKVLKVSTKIEKIDGEKGGTISGEGLSAYEKIKYGDDSTKEILIKPDVDHEIISITVNGKEFQFEANDDDTYIMPTLENVTGDIEIVAKFALKDNKIVINKIDSISNEPVPNVEFQLKQLDERPLPDNNEILGDLTDNGKIYYDDNNNEIQYNFVEENGKYVSTNQGVDDTVCNSYIPIDLRNLNGNYVVTVNAEVSTENGDYGYVSINKATQAPNYSTNTGRLFLITGNQSAKDYSVELESGNLYYLHLGYFKNATANTTGEDKFTINSISLNLGSVDLYKTNVVTNSQGEAITQIPFGKYVVTEVGAPEDYFINENSEVIEFRSTNGAQHEFTIEDDRSNKVIVHHYLKGTTTKVAEDDILRGRVGEKYASYPNLDISKYELEKENGIEVLPSNQRGEFIYGDQEVIYNYVAREIPVRVNHYIEGTADFVPLKNGENALSETIWVEENGTYNTSPITEENLSTEYELVEIPENASGEATDEEIIVNYYYRRTTGTLLINKVDKDTKEPMRGVKFEVYEGDSGKVELPEAQNIGNIYEKEIADLGNRVTTEFTLDSYGNNTFREVDGKYVPENCYWYINNFDFGNPDYYADAYIDIDLSDKDGKYVIVLNAETANSENNDFYVWTEGANYNLFTIENENVTQTEQIVVDGGRSYRINLTYYSDLSITTESYASLSIDVYEAVNISTTIENDLDYFTEIVADYDQEISFEKTLRSIPGVTPFAEENGNYVPANCKKYMDDNNTSYDDLQTTYASGYIPIELEEGWYIVTFDAKMTGTDYNDTLYVWTTDNPINGSYYSNSVYLYGENTGTYSFAIDGRQAKAIMMEYYSNSNGEDDYVYVKNFKIYKAEEVLKEYGFEKTTDGKYVSNIYNKDGYQAHSVIPIDLRGREGNYTLTVNAEISTASFNNGKIYITDNIIDYQSTYRELLAEVRGDTPAQNYRTVLDGGNIYYLHFTYYKDWDGTGGDNRFTINSIDIQSNSYYELVTDQNGNAEVELLTGDYTITEIETLEGYELPDESMNVSVPKEGLIISLENEKIKGNVNVKFYYEGTEDSIIPDATLRGVPGEEYEIYEDGIPKGYELINWNDKYGTFEEGSKEVILYYKIKDAKLVVEYRDKVDDSLLDTHEENTQYFEKINLEDFAEDKDGYVLDREFENVEVEIIDDVVTVTIYYEPKSEIIVHYMKDDEEVEKKTIECIVGDEETIYPISIDGYIVVERPDNETIIVTRDVQEFYYYYKKVSEGVIEKHIDADDGRLLYEEYHEGEIGKEYNIEPKEFDRYELDEETLPDNTSGEMTDSLIEVVYKYNYISKVTIRYVDQNETDLEDPLVINGHIGDDYTSTQKEFEKYDFVEVTGEPEGTMTRDDIVVTYKYEESPRKVIVNYIDVSDDQPIETDTQTKYEGEEYSTEPINIDDYDVVEERLPANSSGEMGDEDIIINYYYIRKATVSVKYINFYTGEPITEETWFKGHVGDEYEAEMQEIPGYKLVRQQLPNNSSGTMTKDPITVTYYYVKEAKVTERHVYNDTVLYEETHDGMVGEDYFIEPMKFDNYIVDEENLPSNNAGKYGEEDIVVTYRYVEKAVVIEKHIDEDAKEILAYEKHEGRIGDKYNISSRRFPGYDIMYTSTENNMGVMTKEPIEVVFWYKKAQKQETPAESQPKTQEPAQTPVTVIITDGGTTTRTETKTASNTPYTPTPSTNTSIVKNVTANNTVKENVEYKDSVSNVPDTESETNKVFYVIAVIIALAGVMFISKAFKYKDIK